MNRDLKFIIVLFVCSMFIAVPLFFLTACSQKGMRTDSASSRDYDEGGTTTSSQGVPMEDMVAEESEPQPAAAEKKKKAGKKTASTWKRSHISSNTARLMIGDREELPLKGTQINVRVEGFRARVLIDMYFLNDRDRMYEGRFQLRLPDGATPYFLAFGESVIQMDQKIPFYDAAKSKSGGWAPAQIMKDRSRSWQSPKEAKMVTKVKAAHAFRETVRKRVDPALMEWAGAGVFNTSVYPLNPKRLHRIVVGYDTDLVKVGSNLEYRLGLPRNSANTVVDIHVAKMSGVDIKVFPNIEGTSRRGQVHFRYEIPLERSLLVRLENAKTVMMQGKDKETGDYFAARFTPDLPDSTSTGSNSTGSSLSGSNSKGSPFAVFMVDISLSSNPDSFNIWLSMLESLLANNEDQLKRFAVLFFNIESFWYKEEYLANTSENRAGLLAFARTLALEGATDMASALREATSSEWQQNTKYKNAPDLFLLGDGASTWGESDLHVMTKILNSASPGALFAYKTGFSGTDTKMLNHLTRESGGALFSVVSESAIQKASVAHRSRPWKIDSLTLEGTEDLLLAGRPKVLFPGQTLVLAGRGKPGSRKSVNLNLSQGIKRHVMQIPLPKPVLSDLAPRVYGQIAVGQLETFKDLTRLESEAYARHFRITGQTCSLLMLESEADYQRFNIKPEQDAFVIKSTKVTEIIVKFFKQSIEALADAKTRFMNRLEKMKNTPGFTFDMSAAFQIVLKVLPNRAFDVVIPKLRCKMRTKDQLPGLVREQLEKQKPEYEVFMLETKRRNKKYGPEDGLKVLSSLVESKPGNTVVAGDVGFSAMEMGLGPQAYHLFDKVAAAKPYEPQIYFSMANCLARMNKVDLALVFYEIGLSGRWNSRFGEFSKIMAWDYMRFLKQIDNKILKTAIPDYTSSRLADLQKTYSMDRTDLVVIITWNTDGTDVDLHVKEPSGEVCYYKNRNTKNQGTITKDVTQGFGPEMYMSRKAKSGKYKVSVKYFSKDQNRASTRTRVFVTIYKNWGTKKEQLIQKAVTLETGKQMHDLAEVKVGGFLW
ncbi:DUF2135 domain-containing protein [Desulfobacterales bacterium HSG16]|nr:DUF2135 domain-containing protein [Desulfobacterales bacterium HSG16]